MCPVELIFMHLKHDRLAEFLNTKSVRDFEMITRAIEERLLDIGADKVKSAFAHAVASAYEGYTLEDF